MEAYIGVGSVSLLIGIILGYAAYALRLRFGHIPRFVLRGLFDHAPYIVATFDQQGQMCYGNQQLERIAGITNADGFGKHAAEVFPKTLTELAGTHFAAALKGVAYEEPLARRLTGNDANGWRKLFFWPTYDNQGNQNGVMLTAFTIANTEQIAVQLQRQSIILESIPDPIIAVDNDYRITDWNKGAEQLYGYTAQEAIGKLMGDLLNSHDPEVTRQFEAAFKTGSVYQGHAIRTSKSGRIIHVAALVSRLEDQNGVPVGYIGVDRDITERKQSEEAKRQSDELFKQMFASNPLPMCVYDRNTLAYLDVNTAMVDKYGYSREEFLTMRITQIRPQEDVPRLMRSASIETPSATHMGEWRHRLKNGRIIDVEIIRTQMDYNGHPAALLVVPDITERVHSERILRESEERFRALIENIADVICIVDTIGTIQYVSPSIKRIIDYDPAEVIGMNGFDLLHPDEIETVQQALTFAIESAEERHVTFRIQHRNGSWREMELTGTSALDQPGIQGIVLNARDITERNAAERALRESEERFRALIEDGQEIVAIVDVNGIITYVGPSVTDILGYTPEELIGRDSLDLSSPINVQAIEATFMKTIQDGIGRYAELQVKHKDGSWRTIEAIGKPAFDKPTINGLVINAHDVTVRKLVEEALREAGEKLQAIIQSAPLALVALDLDGNVTLWNPAAERIFGWKEAEVLGQPNPIVPEEDLEEFDATGESPYQAEFFEQLEVVRRRRDGVLVDVSLSTALVRDAEGRISGTITMMADITLQKRAQRKMVQQNEYLAALNETTLALVNRLDADSLLEAILLRAGALLGAQHGYMYSLEPDGQTMAVRVVVGYEKEMFVRHRIHPGEDFSGLIWETGQPLILDNYAVWPSRSPDPEFDHENGLMGVPLRSANQVVGVLCLAQASGRPMFTTDELAIFNQFAELASVAWDNARLYTAAQQELAERKRAEQKLLHQNEYLTALHETAVALTNRLSLDELLQTILMRAGTLLNTPDAFLYLVDTGESVLSLRVGVGFYRNYVGFRVNYGEGLSGRVWASGQTHSIDDYPNWSGRLANTDFEQLESMIGIPLKLKDKVLGVIGLARTQKGWPFSAEELALLDQFAELASVALDNARLYTAAQQELAERKRAEEQLRQLNSELEQRVQRRTAELQQGQAQLRAVLDAMGDGVIYSEQFRIRYTNQAMAELTGYRVEELIGQPNLIFKSSHATEEESLRFVQNFAAPNVTWRGEQCWRRKDGSEFDAALTVRLLDHTDSQQGGAVTVIRDITAEKQLQAQKTEFIANASHELRTPLTNFKTRLYLMRRQPDRTEEHMAVLERVTERMVRLVEDLLDVSRFERGVIPLDRQDVILQELVAEVAQTQQPEATHKCLSLTTDLPTKPMHIFGDPNRLTQVIVNLIVNAINYTLENGFVRVYLYEENGQAILQVQDTGIGIRPENLMRVFEPFFRANEGTARGTGLGLSISLEIVNLHGGSLTVESTPGKGSTFVMRLPLSEVV